MDVSAIGNLYKTTPVGTPGTPAIPQIPDSSRDFSKVFEAAKNMLSETNELQNNAHQEVIKFALGEADNPHDLMIAEQKAALALSYTVAVKDRFTQSYQTIMNMQI